MNDLAALAAELRAEGLQSGDELERAVSQIADAPDDPDRVRQKELLRRIGENISGLVAGGRSVERITKELGVDTESVTFIRGVYAIWDLADQTNIGWLELAMATIEKGRNATPSRKRVDMTKKTQRQRLQDQRDLASRRMRRRELQRTGRATDRSTARRTAAATARSKRSGGGFVGGQRG